MVNSTNNNFIQFQLNTLNQIEQNYKDQKPHGIGVLKFREILHKITFGQAAINPKVDRIINSINIFIRDNPNLFAKGLVTTNQIERIMEIANDLGSSRVKKALSNSIKYMTKSLQIEGHTKICTFNIGTDYQDYLHVIADPKNPLTFWASSSIITLDSIISKLNEIKQKHEEKPEEVLGIISELNKIKNKLKQESIDVDDLIKLKTSLKKEFNNLEKTPLEILENTKDQLEEVKKKCEQHLDALKAYTDELEEVKKKIQKESIDVLIDEVGITAFCLQEVLDNKELIEQLKGKGFEIVRKQLTKPSDSIIALKTTDFKDIQNHSALILGVNDVAIATAIENKSGKKIGFISGHISGFPIDEGIFTPSPLTPDLQTWLKSGAQEGDAQLGVIIQEINNVCKDCDQVVFGMDMNVSPDIYSKRDSKLIEDGFSKAPTGNQPTTIATNPTIAKKHLYRQLDFIYAKTNNRQISVRMEFIPTPPEIALDPMSTSSDHLPVSVQLILPVVSDPENLIKLKQLTGEELKEITKLMKDILNADHNLLIKQNILNTYKDITRQFEQKKMSSFLSIFFDSEKKKAQVKEARNLINQIEEKGIIDSKGTRWIGTYDNQGKFKGTTISHDGKQRIGEFNQNKELTGIGMTIDSSGQAQIGVFEDGKNQTSPTSPFFPEQFEYTFPDGSSLYQYGVRQDGHFYGKVIDAEGKLLAYGEFDTEGNVVSGYGKDIFGTM